MKVVVDKIFEGFLRSQAEEGIRLARSSDLLDLVPDGQDLPQRYVAHYYCRGLVRNEDGEVSEADRFAVGIRFPCDYLGRADPMEVLTWLGPRNFFHPNVSAPVICVGRFNPGTTLVDILYQLFEIITYKKVTMREDDALNPTACAWARNNKHRFPIDGRSLKRRALHLQIDVAGEKTAAQDKSCDSEKTGKVVGAS